ncbi:MAG TPA: hypothetical protein VHG93_25815 [Longimicrobium sp.]|nr:hypothetical protein [Longimicrobium sp.]
MPGFKFSTFTQTQGGVSYTLSISQQQQSTWDGSFVIIDQGPPRVVPLRGELGASGVLAFSGVVDGDGYALCGYGTYDGAATISGNLFIRGLEAQGPIRLDLRASAT